MIGGVAAGLANYLGLPVLLVRVIWAFLLLPGGIPGLLPYLILWVVIPSEKDSAPITRIEVRDDDPMRRVS
jgi:phage shock protein PspC (stress-responsive transcriptional regulator)